MISTSVLTFFGYLLLPWVITKAIGLVAGRGRAADGSDEPVRVTQREQLIYTFVIVCIVHYLHYCVGGQAPQNFFQTTNSSVTAPVFMLRDQYRSWVAERINASAVFAEAAARLEPMVGTEDLEALYMQHRRHRQSYTVTPRPYLALKKTLLHRLGGEQPADAPPSLLVPDEQFEFEEASVLLDKLRSPARRAIALKYGERALLDCTFCSEDTDYMYFSLPPALLTYLWFLLCGGLLSSVSRKSGWRNIYLLVAASLLVCEVLYYVAPNELAALDLYAYLFPADDKASVAQKLEIVRKLLFAAALALGLLIDSGPRRSNLDIVVDVQAEQERALQLSSAARLQQLAILTDPNLRKQYAERLDREQAAYGDAAFSRQLDALTAKYDMTDMTRVAAATVEQLLAQAEAAAPAAPAKVPEADAESAEDAADGEAIALRDIYDA